MSSGSRHRFGAPWWRRVFQAPTTRLGWWSAGLTAAFVALFAFNAAVLMPATVEVAWQQALLPIYGIVMLLCGLSAGATALIAVIWRHERSWMVWPALLPGLFVLFLVIGELLGPH